MVNCPEYISDFQLTESNFHRLYLDYYPSLILYARRILKEEEGWAEDLVQDVFICTWEANREIREAENIVTYLYQAVKYRCLNELRNRKRHRLIEDHIDRPGDTNFEMLYFEQEVVRRVNEVVSRLAPKCREIFVKHMDGLSQREIAEQMGISEETVKKQKQIARRIIKEKIGDLWLLFFLFREKSSLCLLD